MTSGSAHRAAHHLLEVGRQAGRVRHDVDGAKQRGGYLAQLADLPVGSDAAAVAPEVSLAQADRLR
jgi:hypothetical protein